MALNKGESTFSATMVSSVPPWSAIRFSVILPITGPSVHTVRWKGSMVKICGQQAAATARGS